MSRFTHCKSCHRSTVVAVSGPGATGSVKVCLLCDTVPCANPMVSMHVGAPNLPDSRDGWFEPFW